MISPGFTSTEQELIVLRAVWELIDEMVNYEIFTKPNRVKDAELVPKTMTHKRLFNILLVDFLSKPNQGSFGLTAERAAARTEPASKSVRKGTAGMENLHI